MPPATTIFGGGMYRVVVVDGLFGLKRGDLRSNWEMEQRGGIATAVEEKKSRRRGGTVRAFR